VRAIVAQAWEAAHGRRRDLIVGVTAPGNFRAHAWLEDERPDLARPTKEAQGLRWSGAAGVEDADASGSDGEFHALMRVPMPR